MEKVPTTILDVSKGVGFGFMYHPVIGNTRSKKTYPFLSRFHFRSIRSKKVKKYL